MATVGADLDEFEYSVGGGDSRMERHTDVVTITYEIVAISP